MRKFILVYNPLSGDASFRHRLDEFNEYMIRNRCFVLSVRTTRKEDTREFIQLAQEVKVEGIIVAGGDGTLHEVVNAMLHAGIDLPIGIIPSGTCNDFATHFRMRYDLEKCCQVIVNGHSKAADVGKVNDSYFLNVASGGLFTSVAHNVETPLKNTLGKMAYYLKGLGQLPHFNSYKMKITADGNVIEDELMLFLVMNSGMVGSFPKLAPQAKIDDGKLDLLIVTKCRIAELMGLFVSIMAGNHMNSRHIINLQASTIAIECEEDVESDLDGELGPKLPIAISTIVNRVRFYSDP
jgi:YegS/Rv2252/BmrU family lipid kinase